MGTPIWELYNVEALEPSNISYPLISLIPEVYIIRPKRYSCSRGYFSTFVGDDTITLEILG